MLTKISQSTGRFKSAFCNSILFFMLLLTACSGSEPNNPYPEDQKNQQVLYQSFAERPKHLDPAVAYTSNEYEFLGQIYEPPFQYHYLKRPYQLVPLTAANMPEIVYLNASAERLDQHAPEKDIAFSDYIISIQPNTHYQPHPALAKNSAGEYDYHQLGLKKLESVSTLADFVNTGSRELLAEDFVYQIKRLAHPKVQSPISEMMKNYIVGFDDFAKKVANMPKAEMRNIAMTGIEVISRYQYRIRIKGKYPQFIFWLAMPFFSPMPWEADVFYDQPGFKEKNISLDWYPIGTGAYLLAENNPNRRMILQRNPLFRRELYPSEGDVADKERGLLKDAGKPLPFIDKAVFTLEKETIPFWTKFLQGYFDASGIASDSFDQAIQFTDTGGVGLTDAMKAKGIRLETTVDTAIFYFGFNMLDAIVGGNSEQSRKLRQAIAIAIDFEEYISIFRNGRGKAAQGILPPGIFGYVKGKEGINPYVYEWVSGKEKRKSLEVARQLMNEAGFAGGIDPKTNEALILNFDTSATGIDDRPTMNWYREQFKKLGINLVIRSSDYNRFQEKIRDGNAQMYVWGWSADYPDPENFFFLLYGPNAKVKNGGENAVNYNNPEFDRLFEQMRNMENGQQRYQIIQQMQNRLRFDAPWVFGFFPKNFSLIHSWYLNFKPNLMAHNELKYGRIDVAKREEFRQKWNQPIVWPVIVGIVVLLLMLYPAFRAYRQRLTRVQEREQTND
jgi:ABC-type transport system substrate-binding protein